MSRRSRVYDLACGPVIERKNVGPTSHDWRTDVRWLISPPECPPLRRLVGSRLDSWRTRGCSFESNWVRFEVTKSHLFKKKLMLLDNHGLKDTPNLHKFLRFFSFITFNLKNFMFHWWAPSSDFLIGCQDQMGPTNDAWNLKIMGPPPSPTPHRVIFPSI